MCAKSSQVAEVGYNPGVGAHIHNRHTAHQQVEPVKQWSSVWVTLACQTCASLTVQTCSWVNPFTGESVFMRQRRRAVQSHQFSTCVGKDVCAHYRAAKQKDLGIPPKEQTGQEVGRGEGISELTKHTKQHPTAQDKPPNPSPSLSASISVFLSMFFPCHTFQLTWWSSELPQMYILPPILLVNLWGRERKTTQDSRNIRNGDRDSESNSNTLFLA